MKQLRFIVFGLICFLVGCTENDNELNKEVPVECSTEGHIKAKDLANNVILGKWNWINTTYSSRGTDTKIETPESTNNVMTFEFTEENLKIFKNDILTDELDYTIQFWGEGSNNVDELLVLKFGTGGTSLLFLNTSCLRLVNSYNDAGGDLSFQRDTN